ncbi:MAG: thioesterase family protein [Pseudomonadota bacterium]
MSESLIGLEAEVQQTVGADMLAASVGSGSVNVFATPELILLLEKTAVEALAGHLEDGKTTVGSGLDVTHLAATPVGMSVKATAKVTGVEGRKVIFEVSATDEVDKIAAGTHTRFIVSAESFQARADAKGK